MRIKDNINDNTQLFIFYDQGYIVDGLIRIATTRAVSYTHLDVYKRQLEISSVTMSVESSEQPWGTSQAPQTQSRANRRDRDSRIVYKLSLIHI